MTTGFSMTTLRGKVFLFMCAMLAAAAGSAQNITNKGKEFWVGYGHHQYMERACNGNVINDNTQNMTLYLSAEEPATVKVTIDSSSALGGPATWWSRTYIIPANTVVSLESAAFLASSQTGGAGLSGPMPKKPSDAGVTSGASDPYDARLVTLPPPFGTGGEGIFRKKGIHIESNVPIVAYAHIYGGVSSGATMLLPIEAWGYSYSTINSYQGDADRSYNWMYVIARFDNTKIEITPSALSRLGKPAGVPFTVVLNKGQIYQLIGDAECATGNGVQLTGTKVRALPNDINGKCYPIAVFAGSSRTGGEIPSCGGSGRDNDMQQCFPQSAWGKRYLTAPMSKANGATLTPASFQTNVYKILVKDPNTVVKRNGNVLSGLINNTYYQYMSNTADYIESDKPIMMATFMSNGSNCNTGSGDPEMIYISPIEQSIKRTGFFRNTVEAITSNYLTLIVPTPGVASLRIDGSNAFSHTYAHPNLPGYTVVIKGWAAAKAQCLVRCDSGFNAYTYGMGGAESYGYNAGTNLDNLTVLGDIKNNFNQGDSSNAFTCRNTPFKLSMLVAYEPLQLEWLLSLNPKLSPNANVVQSMPVFKDTVMVKGVKYYKYSLPGDYKFTDTGLFTIKVLSTTPTVENCNGVDTVSFDIRVKMNPDADFTFDHVTGCSKDTVYFHGNTSGSGYTIDRWNWVFPTNLTDTVKIREPKALLPPGQNDIWLRVFTPEGCVSDTVKKINIAPPPVADFNINAAGVCEKDSVTFTSSPTYTGSAAVGTFYWDFGNGQTLTTGTNPVKAVFPAYGTYNVKHVSKVSGLCYSDTVRKVITIYAKPKAKFGFPIGCLPASGIVQFRDSTVNPDNQVLSYLWNFGDAAATAGNPNTAVIKDPTHTYSSFGQYTIKLDVTTANGCKDTVSVTTTFALAPVLSYPALTKMCLKDGIRNVALASVTNSVPGTGFYHGKGVDSAGMLNPLLAGPGVDTVWYVYKTTGGCRDSIKQTIAIYDNPKVNFGFPIGCLPLSNIAQFKDSTKLADAQTMTWSWNFGDANANAGNPNTSTLQDPTHVYTQFGTYPIKLSVVTSQGCTGDTTINATFSIRPVLSYGALNNACVNDGIVDIARASVTNAVPGSGYYKGPGTDSTGKLTTSTAGFGTKTIWYIFKSTGGCTDSVSTTINIYDNPDAGFTYPVGCLPLSNIAQFTDTTRIRDGQSFTWEWNFGDANFNAGNPNTATVQNPTHTYTQFGNYTIRLIAKSQQGCADTATVSATFAVRPVLAFTALPAICENASPVTFTQGSVTNGVPGAGIYKGPGVTSAGVFSPATAGVGTKTIWYVYTTTGNCADSLSQTITVNPKPTAAFNADARICLDSVARFTSTSSVSSGSITGWAWSYGDGNSEVRSNGASFTHAYAAAGTYTVKLAAVSNNSCYSDTATRTVVVNVLPNADFTLPAGVCMPAGNTQFTNNSTVSDGSALSYIWSFGDGGTSTATNPAYVYTAGGNFNITLLAVTANGCRDTTIKPFSKFFDQPIAGFDVTPDSLCQGTPSVFTDNSQAVGTTITKWFWSFGDGSTSTQSTPAKTYIRPGVYNIKLVVTNAIGCVSDTFTSTSRVYLQPKVEAGPSFTVPLGTIIRFNASSNDTSLAFAWTPTTGLSASDSLKPSLVATDNLVYTITATGEGGCTATDFLKVNVMKPFKIPNAFSPNGDGTNDTWVIEELGAYPGATIEVFDRYGKSLVRQYASAKPWDGKVSGKELPIGVYYYIIDPKNGYPKMTGSVTIVK